MTSKKHTIVSEQMERAEKLGMLRRMFVKTRRTQSIRERLALWYAVGLDAPEARAFVLSGDAGTGKTAILRSFVEDVEGYNGKAVYVEVPAKCTIKNLAQAILKATGDPCASKGVLASLEVRLMERLAKLGYTVLILDEAQHLVKSDNLKVLTDVADWLKGCLNQWNIQMVISGIDRIEVLSEVDDQIFRREGGHVRLKPYNMADKVDRNDLKLVLCEIDDLLPFKQKANLHASDMAKKMFVACAGNLGRLTKLVGIAAEQCILNGSVGLTVSSLSDAFEECRRKSEADKVNPFKVGVHTNV